MPILSTGDKVLVTGANGYLSVWVVNQLLEKGYSVRATVRSLDKGKHLLEIFKKYAADGKLELFEVANIGKEGAFDEAVVGMDGIEHLASPFVTNGEHPDDYIKPAVEGTLGVLKSAHKNAPNLKRIVITSSCAAVCTIGAKPRQYTEADWNEASIQVVNDQGGAAGWGQMYYASKSLAEKAAWEFYEANKDTVKWDLVTLNPPYVFGPALHEVTAPSKFNTSLLSWYSTVLGDGPKTKEELSDGDAWVDVRDIAEAHVIAMEKESAGGERIIVSGGSFVWQEWLDAANAVASSAYPSVASKLSKGYPEINKTKVYKLGYDTSKSTRILGIKYRSQEETTKDTLVYLAERGW